VYFFGTHLDADIFRQRVAEDLTDDDGGLEGDVGAEEKLPLKLGGREGFALCGTRTSQRRFENAATMAMNTKTGPGARSSQRRGP
jgi:hypothetical protein